jgi:ribosome-binding ATPase YchF (GTP1/OBG family)
LYVCNVDENSAVNGNKYVDLVKELVKDEDAEVIILRSEQRLISRNWKAMKSVKFFLKTWG